MKREIMHDRRSFMNLAAKAIVVSPLAAFTIQNNQTNKIKPSGMNTATLTVSALHEKIKQVNAGELSIGYVDDGPAGGPVVVLLHGWPYDIHSYVDVVPLLTKAGYRTIVPYLRGFGTTTFLSAATFRNGQQSVFAFDVLALMDALNIGTAIVAGFDWGARTAAIMAALWPDRCKALVSVSGYLIGNQESGKKPLPPKAELLWWYQFYFATDRGKEGYGKNRAEFAKLIWQMASPTWKFDDATFNITASSLNNPDHVDIVIHNYRWRLGISAGDDKYEEFETRLAQAPIISVPTITIEGDANGAPHPDASAYVTKFSGRYAHKVFKGIGHNPPQESPRAFANAIIEVDSFTKKK